jgi:hypothetical protein
MDCRLCRLPADDRLHVTPFGTVRLCEGHGNDLVTAMNERVRVRRRPDGRAELGAPSQIITAVLVSCRYGPHSDEAPDA